MPYQQTRVRNSLAGAAVVAALMVAAPAEAQPEFRRYGAVGVAAGQAARLSVKNLFSPVLAPPNPCHVDLAFVNADGNPFLSRTGEPIARASELLPGEVLALTLRAEEALAATRRLVTAIRPVMAVQGAADHQPGPCDGLASTLEIFDILSGWTTIAVPDPGPPEVAENSAADATQQARFGVAGIARGQVARLNASHIVPPWADVPPGPCITMLEFRRRDGELWTTATGEPVQLVAELLPGQTVSLDLSSRVVFAGSTAVRDVVQPVLIRIPSPGPPDVPPGPCAIVGTLEITDAFTGRTHVFVPDPGPPDVLAPSPGPPEIVQ